MPDAVFDDPRLAALYDPLDPDRSDLDVYAAMVAEFGARSVLDIGCGTGTFAVLLAASGLEVVGVDPALASLGVARGKPFADRVRWIHGDASALPALQMDLATMTANVAQAIVAESDWRATLLGARAALKPGGRLVFETRVPGVRAWESWTPDQVFTTDVAGVGPVRETYEVTEVALPLVTFRCVTTLPSGKALLSTSTLRFREREEIASDLEKTGFAIEEIRDAPDRPGREWVFVARKTALWPAT